MTFGDLEASREEAIPLAMMLFTYGDGATDYYAYTTAEDAVTYNDIVYTPIPVNSDEFTASGSLDRAAIPIRLSKFLPITELFTGFPPSQPITVQVFLGHVGSSDFKLSWPGRVRSHAIEGNDLVLTCESISTSMKRNGLRRHWQRGCMHAVYGPQCKAVQSSFTVNAVVSSVASPYINLPANWNGSLPVSNFVNGIVRWTNSDGRTDYRMILLLTGPTQLVLDSDVPQLEAGMTISLSLGCDHEIDTCINVFHNVNNYGGCKWIPLKNPLGIVNNFV